MHRYSGLSVSKWIAARISFPSLISNSLSVALHLGVEPFEFPHPVGLSPVLVLVLVLLRKLYCWDIIYISLLYTEDIGFQQTSLSFPSYNLSTPLLWCSLSFKCRGCAVDVPTRVKQPKVCSSLNSKSCVTFIGLHLLNKNFFDGKWDLYLPGV